MYCDTTPEDEGEDVGGVEDMTSSSLPPLFLSLSPIRYRFPVRQLLPVNTLCPGDMWCFKRYVLCHELIYRELLRYRPITKKIENAHKDFLLSDTHCTSLYILAKVPAWSRVSLARPSVQFLMLDATRDR